MATKRTLVTPCKLRSDVWLQFGFPAASATDSSAPVIIDKTTVYCRHCDKPYKYNGSTTNLSQHLLRCGDFLTFKSMKEKGVSPSANKKRQNIRDYLTSKKNKLPKGSKRAQELKASIIKHIVVDLKTLSTVEGKGFRHMWNVAVPEFTVPSRATITRDISDLAAKSRIDLSQNLKTISHLSLTCDYWTSIGTKSYLGVTAHFLNEEWELKSSVLGTYQVHDSHTAENVSQHINDVISEWNIANKIVAVVTDSAANMVSAMQNVDATHIRCSAHLLQLSIKKGFDIPAAHSILVKGRKIVGHFNHSTCASEKLAQAQRARNFPTNKLVQDIVTRWNSSRDMLTSLELNRGAINDVFDDHPSLLHLQITNNEKKKIIEMKKLLEPFGELTTLIGGEKYVSSSIVLPTFCSVEKKVLAFDVEDSSDIKDIKRSIRKDLHERVVTLKANKALTKASALDPRFKRLSFLNDEAERTDIWELLQEELAAVDSLGSISQPEDSEEDEFNIDEPDMQTTASSIPMKRSVLEELVDSASSVGDSVENDVDELLVYRTQIKKIGMDKDPLLWWKLHQTQFKKLSFLAKKYLSIPASSVPSERLFSTGGNIITKNRSRLTGSNVDNLMFLHSAYKDLPLSHCDSDPESETDN